MDFARRRERRQCTLKTEVRYSGIGIHTGEQVAMRFVPAEEGSGIRFKRVDLSGTPEILATIDHVIDTRRCTTIGCGSAVVHTVEHVMAALRAYHIDNLVVEVSAEEPPVGNGSSDIFIEMIERGGVEEQNGIVIPRILKEPVHYTEGDIHLIATPHDGYKISYTLNYPECSILKAQYHSVELTPESFKRETAPCRTFARYEEIEFLMDKGLIRGGSLDNAVIIKDGAVLSKGGLFFPDEMVRHKILDVIGDLALIPGEFYAHIIAIRSGHSSNHAFGKKIYQSLMGECQLCQQR